MTLPSASFTAAISPQIVARSVPWSGVGDDHEHGARPSAVSVLPELAHVLDPRAALGTSQSNLQAVLPRADEDQFQTEARRELLSGRPADHMLVVRQELLRRQLSSTPSSAAGGHTHMLNLTLLGTVAAGMMKSTCCGSAGT